LLEQPAPNFKLPGIVDDEIKEVALSDFKGKDFRLCILRIDPFDIRGRREIGLLFHVFGYHWLNKRSYFSFFSLFLLKYRPLDSLDFLSER
jgi:hypothetical protein